MSEKWMVTILRRPVGHTWAIIDQDGEIIAYPRQKEMAERISRLPELESGITWTTEAPTEPGLYLAYENVDPRDNDIILVQVSDDGLKDQFAICPFFSLDGAYKISCWR